MIRIGVAVTIAVLATSPLVAQTPDAIQHGQKVYAAEKCSICHSIGTAGNRKGPLDDVGSKLTADQIREWITHAPEMTAKVQAQRKPAMKAYPNIAKEDLDALVAYMASLKK
jgi:mono/diheme cytochrome c family protein